MTMNTGTEFEAPTHLLPRKGLPACQAAEHRRGHMGSTVTKTHPQRCDGHRHLQSRGSSGIRGSEHRVKGGRIPGCLPPPPQLLVVTECQRAPSLCDRDVSMEKLNLGADPEFSLQKSPALPVPGRPPSPAILVRTPPLGTCLGSHSTARARPESPSSLSAPHTMAVKESLWTRWQGVLDPFVLCDPCRAT